MGASLDRDRVFQPGKGPAGPSRAPPPSTPAVPIRRPCRWHAGAALSGAEEPGVGRVQLPSGVKGGVLLSREVHGGRALGWAFRGHRTSAAQTQQGPATPGQWVPPKGKGDTFTPESSQTLVCPLQRVGGRGACGSPLLACPPPETGRPAVSGRALACGRRAVGGTRLLSRFHHLVLG